MATRRFSTTKYTKRGQNVQTTVETTNPCDRGARVHTRPPSRTPINVGAKKEKQPQIAEKASMHDYKNRVL